MARKVRTTITVDVTLPELKDIGNFQREIEELVKQLDKKYEAADYSMRERRPRK